MFAPLFLLALTASVAWSASLTCENTHQFFSQLTHDPTVRAPRVPVHKPQLTLCERSDVSCCVPEMERVYIETSKSNLNATVVASFGSAQVILGDSAKILEDKLKKLLTFAENATLDVLADVHRIAVPRTAVRDFFQSVQDAVHGLPANISARTRDLFSALYPSLLSGGAAGLPATYRDCVQKAYDQNQPFGKLPPMLADGLERTADAVRAVIDALRRGSEVLKNAQKIPLPRDCATSLARMVYCSHCQGMTSLRLCSPSCSIVASSCLAPLSPLEPSLLGYTQALSQLSLASTEQELRSLDTRISQALVFGMESAPDQELKLLERCGRPQYDGAGDPAVPTPAAHNPNRHWDLDGTLIHAHQRAAQLSLSNMPNDICEDSRTDNGWCWNGKEKIASTKTDLSSDLLPTPNYTISSDVQVLVNQIEAATSMLVSKMSVLPKPHYQADQSSSGEGSGGDPHPGFDDDEDYTGGESGSGSLPDDETTETIVPSSPTVSPEDFDFDSKSGEEKKKGAAGGLGASCALVLVLLAVHRLF